MFEASLLATPRFVTCTSHDIENGNLKEYSWDQEKIFVHECLQDDLLILQNVFEGKIISPLVYPLVFEDKSSQREISMRSLQFYKEVENDASLYTDLLSHERIYFLIGLRDSFIAAARDMLSQDEKQMLVKIVELIDPNDKNIVYKTINNMEVAPYPTASHKMVRFIKEPVDSENPLIEECFVRNELGLLIGFVDPRDLSFHNFENIVHLDSLFTTEQDFPISNFQKHEDNEVYTFDLSDSGKTLLSLDKCGLYTIPINKLSRGGERFIFASRALGNSLTSAINKYVPDKDLINEKFQFVNYVFRYNKFKPGDKKFTSHYDTPYHDPSLQLYSKYTLLLYLTSGIADPILSVDNGKLNINQIEKNGLIKGVIFDQKYEHEGKSFMDSDKIFIRSELIYDYSDEELSFDPKISRKFNIACYMTKQSVFNPELEKYASDCFNQVAQARLNLASNRETKDILLYKKYYSISFVTNGYDYWFQKDISLKAAAIMTVLDYFGCKYKDENGSESNESNKIKFDMPISEVEGISDVKEIFKFLQNQSPQPHQKDSKEESKFEGEGDNTGNEDEDDIFESLKSELKARNKLCETDEAFKKVKKVFCDSCGEVPEHWDYHMFIEGNHSKIRTKLADLQEEFTIFIFNKEIKIKKSNIKINNDTIIFDEKIPSVNFAACREHKLYDDYIGELVPEENLLVSGYTNIPPIPYIIYDEGYHLKIELFNNGFVRSQDHKLKKYNYE